jgi:hypothetical protein
MSERCVINTKGAVAAPSKAGTLLERADCGIVVSHAARRMDVFPGFPVFLLSCVRRGLTMDSSPNVRRINSFIK